MPSALAADIKLFYDPVTKGEFADVELEGGDFVQDGGLETLIIMSLKSDALVDARDTYNRKPGGYYGDALLGVRLGSKIWTLDRSKATKETTVLLAQYAREALDWMVTEGILDRVETYARKAEERNRVDLFIAVYRPDGQVEKFQYRMLWENQLGA